MLSEFQFGFRPKHTAVSALIYMCDEWLENMDNGKLNGVVFLNHDILLKKMSETFGISGMGLK